MMASNAPSACAGAGGAVGEKVSIKVGGHTTEPQALSATPQGDLKMNIDIGQQAEDGSAATVIGNLANGLPGVTHPPRYIFITRWETI
jgi:hypothetical protein